MPSFLRRTGHRVLTLHPRRTGRKFVDPMPIGPMRSRAPKPIVHRTTASRTTASRSRVASTPGLHILRDGTPRVGALTNDAPTVARRRMLTGLIMTIWSGNCVS